MVSTTGEQHLSEYELLVVGDVYWAATWIFGGSDPKPERPCVVVRAPTSETDVVMVITRTTDLTERGVRHPRDPVLGLNEDGVFAGRRLHSAEARHFRPPQVRHAGALPEPYRSRVIALYEEG
jgi:hypothetical protein